jgi:GH24 family phage-related lysozyme (muramidase)
MACVHFEGNVLTEYTDQAGVQTIGKGHRITAAEQASGSFPGGARATKNEAGKWVVTAGQSEAIFMADTGRFAADIQAHVDPAIYAQLQDYQIDALILWDYNTGGLDGSELLHQLNLGNFDEVPIQMLRWDHRRDPNTGRLVEDVGLLARRRAEGAIWSNGYEHPAAVDSLDAARLADTAKQAFELSFDLTDQVSELSGPARTEDA